MRRHAKICWSDEVVAAADATHDINVARAALQQVKKGNMSITAAFEMVSEGKAVYRTHQFTMNEARYAWIMFHLTRL